VAGRDRGFAAQEYGMDDAAHMPELGDDTPARFVDGGGDRLPPFDLRIGPKARALGQPALRG
jgi:hypothetical protein